MDSFHLPEIRDPVPKKVIEKMCADDPTLFNRKQCSIQTHQRTRSNARQWLDRIIPTGRSPVFERDGRTLEGYAETGVCKDCGSHLIFHSISHIADVFERRAMREVLEG